MEFFRRSNPLLQARLSKEAKDRESSIAFENDQTVVIRIEHHDQRFDIQIAVRRNRLKQLVQFGTTVKLCDDPFIGGLRNAIDQSRVLSIKIEPFQGNLRG